jgi:hypothetical protein
MNNEEEIKTYNLSDFDQAEIIIRKKNKPPKTFSNS